MSDTPCADLLELAYATGDLYDMDVADLSGMAKTAVSEGAAGDADGTAAFQFVMDDYLDHVSNGILESARGYFAQEDADIHAPARRGMVRNLGITDDVLAAAEAARDAGDPAPLLKLQTAYMESM